MLDKLKEYRIYIEAIRMAEANMDLEKDMKELDIDKKKLEKKLVNDIDIINKVKESVNYYDRG